MSFSRKPNDLTHDAALLKASEHHRTTVGFLTQEFHTYENIRPRSCLNASAVNPSLVSRLCERGVAACGANQAEGPRLRLVPNREHLFPSVHQKPGMNLRSSRALYGRARQPQNWPTAQASASARQNSGYPGSAILRTTRSWSFSTRSAGGTASVRSPA
jgi:hypothetical protein